MQVKLQFVSYISVPKICLEIVGEFVFCLGEVRALLLLSAVAAGNNDIFISVDI